MFGCDYCGNELPAIAAAASFVSVHFPVESAIGNKRDVKRFCDWECAAEFAAEVVGGELTIG